MENKRNYCSYHKMFMKTGKEFGTAKMLSPGMEGQ